MKVLLTITAAIEAGAGLALLVSPSAMARVLLGSSLETRVALVVARMAGAALLALGISCWMARDDGQSRAARGVIAAMLVYNAAVVALLADARLRSGLSGMGLWPAVILHSALAVWCSAGLRARRPASMPQNLLVET